MVALEWSVWRHGPAAVAGMEIFGVLRSSDSSEASSGKISHEDTRSHDYDAISSVMLGVLTERLSHNTIDGSSEDDVSESTRNSTRNSIRNSPRSSP